MNSLCVASLFLLFSQVVLGNPLYDEGRIVGGEKAAEGRYPFIASIRSGTFHFCGGSILNKRWVVTAAHCVENVKPSTITVVVGTNQLEEGGVPYKVQAVHWHKDFNIGTLLNDVALLNVAENIKFNKRVQPISVLNDFLPEGNDITIAGWGSTSVGSGAPNDLQFVNVQSISTQTCRDRLHGSNVQDTQVCTFSKSEEGACHGDSGGPVITKNGDGEEVLVGLVSWGRPCAVGYPDVHSRVFSFLSWFDSICDGCTNKARLLL